MAVKRPARGGGRWVEVAPARLAGWLETAPGFGARMPHDFLVEWCQLQPMLERFNAVWTAEGRPRVWVILRAHPSRL